MFGGIAPPRRHWFLKAVPLCWRLTIGDQPPALTGQPPSVHSCPAFCALCCPGCFLWYRIPAFPLSNIPRWDALLSSPMRLPLLRPLSGVCVPRLAPPWPSLCSKRRRHIEAEQQRGPRGYRPPQSNHPPTGGAPGPTSTSATRGIANKGLGCLTFCRIPPPPPCHMRCRATACDRVLPEQYCPSTPLYCPPPPPSKCNRSSAGPPHNRNSRVWPM